MKNSTDNLDVGVSWRLDLNPSVTPEDEDRLHAQAKTILARLKRGPISNVNMQEISMQYNARVFEIRAMLEPHGMTVAIIKKQADGVNIYALVDGVNRKLHRKAKAALHQSDAGLADRKTAAETAKLDASQAGRDLAKCRHRKKRANSKQLTLF